MKLNRQALIIFSNDKAISKMLLSDNRVDVSYYSKKMNYICLYCDKSYESTLRRNLSRIKGYRGIFINPTFTDELNEIGE